jgi:hypothetical protein
LSFLIRYATSNLLNACVPDKLTNVIEKKKLNQWVALEALIHEYAQRKGKSYERYGLVMIGDSIQFASKNKMLAGMHRVVRTPEERFSVVYKMRGRPESTQNVGPHFS